MNPLLLVVNAGSSSLKFGVYESDGNKMLDLTYSGQVTGIGSTTPHFRVRSSDRPRLVDRELDAHEVSSLDQAQALVSDWLAQNLKREPDAVGHRIVHGGPNYHDSVLVTPAVLQELEGLASLAPLHQRNNLHPVIAASGLFRYRVSSRASRRSRAFRHSRAFFPARCAPVWVSWPFL